MTELKASLVLQLKNLLRGGIAQVRGELKGLKSEAQGLERLRGPDGRFISRYTKNVEDATKAVRELKRQQATLGATTGQGASGGKLLAGVGRTGLMIGGLYGGAQATRTVVGGTVGQSISFEKAFAQVRKKVDAPDEAAFQQLEKTINRIAAEYGLARGQVAELVAEAGAAGIAFEDLERFMRMTAKAAVAWDMNAPEASQKLAEIKAGTQMTIAELEQLANKINGLGDNSAAKERDIVEMFQRSGAAAKAAGVNFDVSLAALTAVRSTGLQPEIASRWFSAFTGGLRTIEEGTAKSKEGLALLGLDAKKVAEGMKRDALGTMLDIFDRLQKSPEGATAAIKIFGKEWWDETSRAAQALPELRKQLEYLKSGKWGGSLDKTLGIELATTANHLERLKALTSEIGDRMGRWALPPINATIDGFIKKFDELQERLANKPDSKVVETGKSVAPFLFPLLLGPTYGGHEKLKPVREFFGRRIESAEELLFGKKLTKDPAGPAASRLQGSAADAEALARKQTEEAAVLRTQAKNAKSKEDRARLTLEAQKREQEAQANLDQAARNRRAAGQAAARDMTNVEAGEQQIGAPLSQRLPELQAERARIEALLARAGSGRVVQDDASGKFWNVEVLRQQLEQIKSKLGEVSGEAEKTGSTVKDKLTLDLTSQGAQTAMSWAQGLRAGIPAVEAAAQALRAPLQTPAAALPGAARPLNGGGAAAPARPANVQVTMSVTGVQDPEKAARIAETRLAGAIKQALTGAHHDGVT